MFDLIFTTVLYGLTFTATAGHFETGEMCSLAAKHLSGPNWVASCVQPASVRIDTGSINTNINGSGSGWIGGTNGSSATAYPWLNSSPLPACNMAHMTPCNPDAH